MLAEIETAIIARLKAKAPQLTALETAKSAEVLPLGPAYIVEIVRGQAEFIVDESVKQNIDIALWLAFKNLKSDQARRHGAFPIVESIAQLLYNQKLGLEIKKIKYTGFSDVTDQDERAQGTAIFQLDFKTSYTVTQLDEEDTQELLTAGLNYLLNGSEDAAAQDVVTLQNQPGGQ